MEKIVEKQMCSKHRTAEEKQKLYRRLNVIEGQVRGIKQMIEDDKYCDNVLMQLCSVDKALKSLGAELLKSHLASNIKAVTKESKEDVVEDIISLFDRLNK